MSILFLNSAVPTKIRAMQSHLLKKEDLLYLANSENISELISLSSKTLIWTSSKDEP